MKQLLVNSMCILLKILSIPVIIVLMLGMWIICSILILCTIFASPFNNSFYQKCDDLRDYLLRPKSDRKSGLFNSCYVEDRDIVKDL